MENFIFCAMVTVEETLRLVGAQKQSLEVFNKKKLFLNISQNSQDACVGVSLKLKWHSNTGVFL